MKLSILTPCVRLDGLKLVEKSIKRQSLKDLEWIIGSPKKPTNLTIPFVWVKDEPKKEGEYWTVYTIYNEMVKVSQSDLLISWQDHTYLQNDGLERLYNHFLTEPNALVTVVGNKYSDEDWIGMTWKDPRIRSDFGTYYQTDPSSIEWNLCSCPKKAIYDVGGFDQSMNKYSSICGLDVATRLDVIGGYKFMIDQDIKTYSTEHGRLPGWTENEPFLNGVWQKKIQDYKSNPILSYLEKDEAKNID